MPKLDHNGPDGEGSKTGRKLGKCKNKGKSNYELGKGMGLRRNKTDNCESMEKGKRNNTYLR